MPRLHIAWGSSHCWARIFSVFKSFSLSIVKIVNPCSTGFGFLAGPWWDSVMEDEHIYTTVTVVTSNEIIIVATIIILSSYVLGQ